MKTFDRYIGRQVLFATLFGIFVLSFVLVLGNIFKKLMTTLDKYPDLGWSFVLEFILNILPFSLIFTIPWGLLTAILLTFGRLSADNELTSLRMAGLSLPRICVPVFAISLVATAISFWINVEVAPASKSRLSQIFFRIATENPGAMFVEDEVVNTLPGYSVYTLKRDLIDPSTGHYAIKNLVLIKLNSRRQPDIFIQSAQAEIGFDAGNVETLFLQLTHAHLEKTEGDDSKSFFRHSAVRPGQATLQLSLERLRDQERKDKPSYLPSRELTKVAAAEQRPGKKALLVTELHKRYSLSFACLAFCLIGVPLGVTAQRRETSIGFALSMVIAVAYFLGIVIAEVFRDNPQAYPHVLVWMPNIVFIPLGLYLFWRLSRK